MSDYGLGRLDRDALDRHITGNYGEDQFKDGVEWDICGEPLDADEADDGDYCVNPFPCSEHPPKAQGLFKPGSPNYDPDYDGDDLDGGLSMSQIRELEQIGMDADNAAVGTESEA